MTRSPERSLLSFFVLVALAVLCVLSLLSCDDAPAAAGEGDTGAISDECEDEDTFDPASCPTIAAADAMVRFVDADVAAPGDGRSWSAAFRSVQAAVDACECVALATGETCEVWVAAGEYMITLFCTTDTLRLRPNVALYGGFAGNEASLDQRDFEANATILTGLSGNTIEPSVVTGSDDAAIDGFAIRGAQIGLYNESASPTVTNCTFSNNIVGMDNESASPTVTNCTFSGNSEGMDNNDASPIVTGCAFLENNDGMDSWWSAPTVTDCVFSGNPGSGMYNDNSPAIVTRCVFTANGTFSDGQFTNATGGGMANWESSPTVTDCVFSRNSATQGGGMGNLKSSPTVTNCAFFGNHAVDGGGMGNLKSSPTVTNCTFWGNTADTNGGGMCNFAALLWSDPDESTAAPAVRNSVLFGNAAGAGGDDLWNKLADTDNESDTDDVTASAAIEYSDVAGGCGAIAGMACGDGNLGVDPLFVNTDTDAGDIDLHLQTGSPCVDTGLSSALPADVTTDLDGNPRVVGASVDMGAYELQE